jgi:hypothetical protein
LEGLTAAAGSSQAAAVATLLPATATARAVLDQGEPLTEEALLLQLMVVVHVQQQQQLKKQVARAEARAALAAAAATSTLSAPALR